jgi:hypothetical protein
MGLHDHPAGLREAVQAEIDRLERQPGVERILLAYARCGEGLAGIVAGRAPLVIPRADDCVTLFLGGGEAAREFRRKHPDWYFASPGWARGGRLPGPGRERELRELYRERYDDDEEVVDELLEADRETFQHYTTLGCLRTSRDPSDETALREACQECAAAMGWKLETMPGQTGQLRALLEGPWPDDRFLTVHPGQKIIPANDERVLTTAP